MTAKKNILIITIFLVVSGFLSAEESFDWKETRTRHFVFVYQQQDDAAARELVSVCETVYKKISVFFDNYPDTIRCVLRGETDYANGMFSPMPNRLELYVRSPTGPWAGAGYRDWLEYLLIHELTHYMDLVADRGFFFVLSLFMGEGVRVGSAGFWPIWLIEGIAVNNETDFTRGGRGRNEFFLMRARALAMERIEFNLGQLEYGSVYPPADRYYLYGYLLINYLRRHYGADIYQRIRERFLAFPFFGPWGAISEVTGKHQDELLREMYDDLKNQWKKTFDLPQGRLVSSDTYGDVELPYPVPGGYITYRTNLAKPGAFVLLDKQFREIQILYETELNNESSFSVSSDGTVLVFSAIVQSGSNNDMKSISELYRMNIAYTNSGSLLHAERITVKRISENGRLWHPAISADGTQCAAVQSTGSYSRLVSVNMDTGVTASLFEMEQINVFYPSFSPDGSKLAFVINARGVQDIGIIDLSIPASRQPLSALTLPSNASLLFGPDLAGDYFPRFVDNTTLMFSSDRGGTLGLYAWSFDKNTLALVHADPVGARAGIFISGGLLYQTVSSKGNCLRLLERSLVRSQPVTLPPRAEIPAAPQWDSVASNGFIDWPMFQFWLPYGDFFVGDGGFIYPAIGITLYNNSLLDSNSWDLSIGSQLFFLQPDLQFNFRTSAGPLDFLFGISHKFTWVNAVFPYYNEKLTEAFSIAVPFLERYEHNHFDMFQVYGGIQHSYFIQDYNTFPFMNGFQPELLANRAVLSLFGGIQYLHYRVGGSAEMFPVWTFRSTIDWYTPLPVFNDDDTGFVLTGRFSYSVPGIMDLHALKIGLKAAYASDELVGQNWIVPRGLFEFSNQTENGQLIVSADYLCTIAVPDAALFGGIHVDEIGMGFHVEFPVIWSLQPGMFRFEHEFFAGFELTFLAGIGALKIPLGIGFNVRLNMDDIGVFDISRDLRPYFFMNFDSFFYADAQRKPARPEMIISGPK